MTVGFDLLMYQFVNNLKYNINILGFSYLLKIFHFILKADININGIKDLNLISSSSDIF